MRAPSPRFKRLADAPPLRLTPDDVEILRRVFRSRFLRADDVYRLFADRSSDKLSRRLVRLYRNHYLDRPIAQVDRFREGGSQSLVYGLDRAGARYLAETEGVDIGSGDWKSRNRSYTRDNLDHTLAVAGFLVDLELAGRRHGTLQLIHLDEVVRGTKPVRGRRLGQWPVPVAWHGMTGSVQIAPDAIVGLRVGDAEAGAKRSFLFVEVDRGTMTIEPARRVREDPSFLFRATILRKLLTYAQSYRQGLHKEHLGIPAARVLFLTTTDVRARAMQSAAQHFIMPDGNVPAGLFLFGVHERGRDPLASPLIDALGQPATLLPASPPSTG